MITQLTITQFAIIDTLVIDFSKGMTAITGETGAGKSIAIDALGLCLGARADVSMIRQGAQKSDIIAHFVIEKTSSVRNWLEHHQLEDGDECILRRVINCDGRSKAFINGRNVPISQLRELGHKLIQIHGQHEHQLLMKPDHQHLLMDHYLSDRTLLGEMKSAFSQWKSAVKSWKTYQKQRDEYESKRQLLQYQLQELDEFAPISGEFEKMEEEYKRLSNNEQLLRQAQHAVVLLSESDDYTALQLIHRAKQVIEELMPLDSCLTSIAALLDEASIHIVEASNELRHYVDNSECNPERLAVLEERIAKQIALARKHHVAPSALPECYQNKRVEWTYYEQRSEEAIHYKQQMDRHYQTALKVAEKLHEKRIQTSQIMTKKITHAMRDLSMTKGRFGITVEYDPDRLQEDGADTVMFLMSTNEGQPLLPISKIASGGELSRLALAIQVLTAQKNEMPVLIFDEVDSGISGPTAAKVGNLLRQLGSSTQVVTVTHLPQVAGNAHSHLFVDKYNDRKQTKTIMKALDLDGRITELARLLGGDKITPNTIANAKELLIETPF